MEENNNMPNYIKLSEFTYSQAKDAEILKKISFFLSNNEVNPYEYMVNPENGNFYKIETKEVYEIRQNKEGNYELYNENEAKKEKEEEKVEASVDKKDIKIRRLTNKETTKSAAFVSNNFIIAIASAFAIIIGLILSQIM